MKSRIAATALREPRRRPIDRRWLQQALPAARVPIVLHGQSSCRREFDNRVGAFRRLGVGVRKPNLEEGYVQVPVSNSASFPFAQGYLALIGQGLLSMSKLVGNQLPIGTELIRDRSAGVLQLTHKPVTISLSSLWRC